MWTVLKIGAAITFLAGAVFGGSAVMIDRAQIWAAILGPIDRAPVDFGILTRRDTPNEFLACTSICRSAEPDIDSPVIAAPVDAVRGRFFDLVDRLGRAEIVDFDPLIDQYDVEEVTRVFGFPDTITVRLIEIDPTQTMIAIYSRSHYGKWDFDLNEKRVRAWIDFLAETR